MPTNLQNLIRAEERMRLASEEQRAAFIGRPHCRYSPKDRVENKLLLRNIERLIAEYRKAFERMAKTSSR
jgi:hypothetical protein